MDKSKLSTRQRFAIISLLLVITITVLDVFIVNVALPMMAEELHITDSQTIWIVTAYQLVIAMLMLPLATLGDTVSYRKVMLIGVTIFLVASALCALSPNFTTLLISRIIQGFGVACIMAVDIAMVRVIYPKEIIGRGLALNAIIIAVATAAAPTVAGAILSVASWQWLFVINIPLGLLAIAFGYKTLPDNTIKAVKERFDWFGTLENMIVFGFLFYGIGTILKQEHHISSAILVIAGVIIGIHFCRRESKMKVPMLPIDLFKIRLYRLSISTYTFSFIAQSIAMVSLPFLFFSVMGLNEMKTGLLMTPWPIATMITSPIAARLAEKYKPSLVAASGMIIFVLGLGGIIGSANAGPEYVNIGCMALRGTGFGLFQTPNNIVMVQSSPVSRTGAAGGMQATSRLIGQTLGATIVTLIFSIISNIQDSVSISLAISIVFALVAALLSLSRTRHIPQYQT